MKNKIFRSILLLSALIIILACLVSCSKEAYDYDLEEYITVPDDISGLTVTDEEINSRVSEIIENQRKDLVITAPVTDRVSESGDMLNISFVCYTATSYGTDNKTELKTVSDSNCNIVLGEGKYPIELENSLLGLSSGNKKVIKVTYPSDYSLPQLAGTTVIFEVTVNSITSRKLPEYNNAFVISVSSFETKTEYEENLKKQALRDYILDYYLKNSTVISYPQKELEKYSGDFVSYYTGLATASGVTLDEYVSKKFFITSTAFHEKATKYAQELVTEDLIIHTLSRRYSVKITDEEYKTEAEFYASKYGYRSVAALEGKLGKDIIMFSIIKDKTLDIAASDYISVRNMSQEITD